jgi:23S rRNA-/tRNA-specific pseudouridylate synthase
MMRWQVPFHEAGSRLSHFLQKRVPALSLSRVKQALESNRCLINGTIERFASTKVRPGDQVSFLHYTPAAAPQSPILFEDETLLVCDKPAGLTSEPDGVPSLFPGYLLVHRLDRDTTGVLLFAKTAKMHQDVAALFKERKVRKEYLAIVDRIPKTRSGVIENSLGKKGWYEGQTIWGEVAKGAYAKTEWILDKGLKRASLLRCFPVTGRTHQIRVHLHSIGHPILGDAQYARTFACPYLPTRTLLHAQAIHFEHPMTKQPLSVTAPLPPDFKEALKVLSYS